MPAWQRLYLAACAGVIAFALGYIGVDYGKVPRVVYDPIARRFTFGRPVGVVMGYPGQWGWAWIFAGVIFAAAWSVVGRAGREKPASDRILGLGLAWAVTAVLLALGYTAWQCFA